MRELARHAEISAATLSELESGGDPRLSTLQRLLAHLPSLMPHDLLSRGDPPVPRASPAAWTLSRDALGVVVGTLRFEVEISGATRHTRLLATGIRPSPGAEPGPHAWTRALQLVVMGTPSLRDELRELRLKPGESVTLEDGSVRHVLRMGRQPARHGLSYERVQVAAELSPGMPASAVLAVSAPLASGASLAIDLAIERLEIALRLDADPPPGARVAAWPVQLPMPPDETDLATRLHGRDAEVHAAPRSREVSAVVLRPMPGLHYGLGWAREGAAVSLPAWHRRSTGTALRDAREQSGLSQRELAARARVSSVTIAGCERGQDVRASVLRSCVAALGCDPGALLDREFAGRAATRLEAWEIQRLVFGLEADEERKTLRVTPEGDAHALCETHALRRVRPSEHELRLRYSSALPVARRLPTVLKAIENAVAEKTEESGLKARVVERREGRLIHEIIVPKSVARSGVSYSRRLFDQGFFAPGDEPARSETGGHPLAPLYDGAALVPSHPVRRLVLQVLLPPGWFPSRVVAGVHPRMRLDGPLPEADVSATLHPEGLELVVSREERSIRLVADHPLVGFMYDVFWQRG